MKKIILLSLILLSCKTQPFLYYKKDQCVVITWKNNSDHFDLYLSDSMIAQTVPCMNTNQLVLHDYREGEYTFIFKNNGTVTEEKRITITSQK